MAKLNESNPNIIRIPGSSKLYSRRKMLGVLLVPIFMSLMQVSSVNTVLATMQHSLNASDSQIQWVISGYALTIGIILVPSGRLGDIFGRSGAYLTGLAVFSVASLLIGCAGDPTSVNVLRLLQGVGSGLMSPQATGLIIEYFQGKARAKAFALFGLVIAASVAAGPVMSGSSVALFGEDVGWRMSFWINFPIGITGMILGFLWLPFGKERRTIGRNKYRAEAEYEAQALHAGSQPVPPVSKLSHIDIDPVGMVLLACAVTLIMLPFMLTGSALYYLLTLAGFAVLAAWLAWEKSYKKRGKYPQVDLELFKIFTFRYGMAIISIHFLGMTSVWVVLSMFFQTALGATALQVGLISLPNAAVSAVAALWAGKYAIDHGRSVQILALSCYLLGLMGCIALVYAAYHGASMWFFILPTLLMGFGGGAIGSANQTQTMLEVPPKEGGTAGGVLQTGQRMTTAIGIAVITAIYFAVRGSDDLPHGNVHLFWGAGAALGFSVVILLIALIIAIVFWKKGRDAQNLAPHV